MERCSEDTSGGGFARTHRKILEKLEEQLLHLRLSSKIRTSVLCLAVPLSATRKGKKSILKKEKNVNANYKKLAGVSGPEIISKCTAIHFKLI